MYQNEYNNVNMVREIDLSFIQTLISLPTEKKLLLQGIMIGLDLNNGLQSCPPKTKSTKRDSADSPKQAHV